MKESLTRWGQCKQTEIDKEGRQRVCKHSKQILAGDKSNAAHDVYVWSMLWLAGKNRIKTPPPAYPFRMESKDPSAEGFQRLAAAIIVQAFDDLKKQKRTRLYYRNLCESSKRTAVKRHNKDIIKFIFGPAPTMDALISLAGLRLDPNALRERARQILDERTK